MGWMSKLGNSGAGKIAYAALIAPTAVVAHDMINPPAVYAHPDNSSSFNCVSYKNVRASLDELARSQKIDPTVSRIASDADYILKHHPKTAKLVEEAISNASCKDIAQIVESVITGLRDDAIRQTANQVSHEVNYAGRKIEKFVGEVKSGIVYAGREVESAYKEFKRKAEIASYGIIAVGVALALYYFLRKPKNSEHHNWSA